MLYLNAPFLIASNGRKVQTSMLTHMPKDRHYAKGIAKVLPYFHKDKQNTLYIIQVKPFALHFKQLTCQSLTKQKQEGHDGPGLLT